VDERDWMAKQFESHRPHLRAVAYRMLGSVTEAEDAVQESWLRLSRAHTKGVDNLGGWLTTVVGRVCLDTLRARRARPEQYAGTWLPEPILSADDADDPEQEALLAEGVGLALLVVLETLTPAERLAFVLHDMFAVPFEEIAEIAGRTRRRRASSRAGRGAGCRAPHLIPSPTSRVSASSSMPFWRPHERGTSTPSSRCSIPRSCCGSTRAPAAPQPPW